MAEHRNPPPMLITGLAVAVCLLMSGFLIVNTGLMQLPSRSQLAQISGVQEETKTETAEVYLGRVDGPHLECDTLYPVERQIDTEGSPEAAMLLQLFAGPTPEERAAGYTSMFSSDTEFALKRVVVRGSSAYVDLNDIRQAIPGASSSCGSIAFRAQIEKTLMQSGKINKVLYAINGDPRAFWEWMQVGCTPDNDNCDPAPFQ